MKKNEIERLLPQDNFQWLSFEKSDGRSISIILLADNIPQHICTTEINSITDFCDLDQAVMILFDFNEQVENFTISESINYGSLESQCRE